MSESKILFPIILAAGQGTRMRSQLPKVLHPVGGKPMLQHVIDACKVLTSDPIAVIYGHGGEKVQETISEDVIWIQQAEQKGTGHAVAQAIPHISDDSKVIIAYGDVPLIRPETLSELVDALADADLTVLTTELDKPFGYGRIVRNGQGQVERIVEEKDADDEIRKITEVNTGFIAARGADLKRWLEDIEPNNAQGEYYLTDCIEFAVSEKRKVVAVVCDDDVEVQGVNNRIQQAELERAWQKRLVTSLMEQGVTVMDPARVDIRGSVTAGLDVVIDVNTVFIGEVTLGDGVVIEPGCVVQDSTIAAGSRIKANSSLESAEIGEDCDVGPFARIRPGTVLKNGAKIGNFVETKKAVVGEGSKISHLSYIGDTTMGADVNIGAGTITCNYDGVNKHQTIIGDDVFVGSDSQFVAPVTVAAGTTIGAGSTITKDTPAGELTLSRAKQITINGWKRPVKKS